MQNNLIFKSIGIAGLGLIGGSFAKAFNRLGIKVYGYDIDKETVEVCGLSGIFDGVTDDYSTFTAFPAELIYICLPVQSSIAFIKRLGDSGIKTPVTDAASCKNSIIKEAEKYSLDFCGGHPIRGRETSGFDNSDINLFVGAKHILVPCKNKNLADNLKTLHESIGMKVVYMEAEEHDKTLAVISHLPHIASFCLIDMVENNIPGAFDFIGGGFRDFTRIAASDPTMWSDIFTDNSSAILECISYYSNTLDEWKRLIENNDYETLRKNILKVSNKRRTL